MKEGWNLRPVLSPGSWTWKQPLPTSSHRRPPPPRPGSGPDPSGCSSEPERPRAQEAGEGPCAQRGSESVLGLSPCVQPPLLWASRWLSEPHVFDVACRLLKNQHLLLKGSPYSWNYRNTHQNVVLFFTIFHFTNDNW